MTFSSLLRALATAAALILTAAPALAQSPTRTRLITASPSPAGQPTTLTAEVDALGGGAPRGAVSFSDGVTDVGAARLTTLGAGQATITAGRRHTCGLSSDGGVKCWGRNYYGALGDGTRTDRKTPVSVAGLATGIVAVSAGGAHTCALTHFGAVKCWGGNDHGQLGDGTNAIRLTPVSVLGLSSGVVAIAIGELHSCALTSAGKVECWGVGGRLGSGTTYRGSGSKYTPSQLSGDVTTYMALAAGSDHTCGLTGAGGVRCWGVADHGQTGDGNEERPPGDDGIRWSPVQVIGLESGVIAVTAGAAHSCAITVAGALKCWGRNNHGQVGNGTLEDQFVPVQVKNLESGVVAAEAGADHTCALLNSGAVWCWGDNSKGQLGDGTNVSRLKPALVASIGGFAVSLASGTGHTCALLSPARISRCWGENLYGQLGDGTTSSRLHPVTTASFSGVVRARAQQTATLVPGWRFLHASYLGGATHAASSTFIPHRAQ